MFSSVYLILKVLCLCACAYCACDPESVKDDLIQCFMNNHMGTFYQFPIVPAANYRNLCSNTTCLTYCMELVAAPCVSLDHMVHIDNGDALTAAYLGLCDQLEAEVTSALSCGHMVSNQDALNVISAFQLSLEGYHSTSSENTTVICSEWMTMKAALDTLIIAQCSGTARTHWQTLLNTISHKCDNSLTPSWYTAYKETSNNRCSGAQALLPSASLLLLAAVTLLWISPIQKR
ncbi:uncharacterized protein LOC123542989 [Mercenaria mercenaria]|uniref:uncharacterized protein LOC123542989 n=1 Tax=Mercenaria mercenaria TaxID=6596 RepID=UPI00234F3F25|nr:uncharacterized protein LOC123542989 [Mercenaria mercenaria]